MSEQDKPKATDAPEHGAKKTDKIEEQYIVKFRRDESDDEVKGKVGADGKHVKKLDDKIHLIKAHPGKGQGLKRKLEAMADAVEYIEEDADEPPALTPNDPSFASQWYLGKIGATAAWDRAKGVRTVTIAILDSGIDPNHPDLKPNLVPGYNFRDGNSNTADVFGHGTKAAGCCAAVMNNAAGIAGVAGGCSIMPLKIASDTTGAGSISAMISALAWARGKGVKVANISFQNLAKYTSIRDAGLAFQAAGGVVCIAAGNTGVVDPSPSNPGAVFVGATDSGDALASWSTRGAFVDVSAPGVSILTTVIGGGYSSVNGTSFASPICAGAFALLFCAKPGLTPKQAIDAIVGTVKDLGAGGYDQGYGAGRIDVAAALNRVLGL